MRILLRLGSISILIVVLLIGLFIIGRWYEAPSLSEQKQSFCAYFLRVDLYNSITVFSSRNNRTPVKASELYPEYLGFTRKYHFELYLCPETRDEHGDMKDIDSWFPYILFAHQGRVFYGEDIDSNCILACDKPGNHKEGANVLFGDGRVEFFTYKELTQLLLQQYASLQDQVQGE